MNELRVRFAPSPTGFLHVGNVRTALYNWLFARQSGGRFILRIEDTDLERSAKNYEAQVLEDLRWLGLDWDEGVEVGGPFGPYRQTDRFGLYAEHARRLLDAGSAYHCFCTAEELEEERQRQLAAKLMPKYSGKCRQLAPERAAARIASGYAATVRLRVREGQVGFDDLVFGPIQVETETIGDPILLRSDGSPNYNFSCVVDDTLMHISHVIRGEGHLSNTHRQILIYEAFGEAPPAFAHLSTILGKDGEKLSKRHGATSVMEFRKMGYLPQAMLNYLALLGWAPPGEGHEILPVSEIVQHFALQRVNRHPATFDPDKLNWVSKQHIKEAALEELTARALPFLVEAGLLPGDADPAMRQWLAEVLQAVRGYMERLDQVTDQTRHLFHYDPADLGDVERQEMGQPEARAVVEAFLDVCRRLPILGLEEYKTALAEVKSRTGAKGRKLFHPIRLAITASTSGLELESLIPLLEKGCKLTLPVPVLGCVQRLERFLSAYPNA